jgi:hypothetical protein
MVLVVSPLVTSCLPFLSRGLAFFVGHVFPTFSSFCRLRFLRLSLFISRGLAFFVRHILPTLTSLCRSRFIRLSAFLPHGGALLVSHVLVCFTSLIASSLTLFGRHVVSWISGRRLLGQSCPGQQ